MNIELKSFDGLGRCAMKLLLAGCLATAARSANGFTPTGSMAFTRYNHTATRLPDGRVLVVAGRDLESGPSASAELYNPATGTWTTTSSLISDEAREFHTATLLPNGKVLVAGGIFNGGYTYNAYRSQQYNPTNGTWSDSGGGNQRYGHTATLLANGKVLFVGGRTTVHPEVNALSYVELYDPASNSSLTTGNLGTARFFHTATLLPNGKVLVAGGTGISSVLTSAELYNPATGTWTNTGSLGTAQSGHTATLLPNGKVLVVRGTNAEVYNPATGTWSTAGSPVAPHSGHTATLLASGKVLLAGGGPSIRQLGTV